MSRDARVELDFADGTYSFKIGWGQIGELQERCNSGPYVILKRLLNGEWLAEDISSVIRLGLIGGGLEPVSALKLVRRYVEERPFTEHLMLAKGILQVALFGAPEEAVGNVDAAGQTVE